MRTEGVHKEVSVIASLIRRRIQLIAKRAKKIIHKITFDNIFMG